MPANRFEASVRQEAGAAVMDSCGEIEGLVQEALDAAYAEAEKGAREVILLNFERVEYISCARLEAGPPGLRPLRPLPGELRDRPPLGFSERL